MYKRKTNKKKGELKMKKIQNIIFKIKMEGEWFGKLNHYEIGEIQSKGYKSFAIEGNKYLVTK